MYIYIYLYLLQRQNIFPCEYIYNDYKEFNK